MIDPKVKLHVTKQAKLLKISKGCFYYRPRPTSERNLMAMPFMDKLHTQSPFVGSRMIRTLLNEMGMKIGRTNIRILMRRTAYKSWPRSRALVKRPLVI